LGGGNSDVGGGIAVDATGAAYVTGDTASTDFPTALPFQTNQADGAWDVFVTKIETPDPTDECPTLPTENVIIGTAGNDKLEGTAGNDLIRGLGGDDTIEGKGGNDCLVGGPGHDLISAGGGNDIVYGGDGPDILAGGPGDDHIDGGAQRDGGYGTSGTDTAVYCEHVRNIP
jgi:Ca2+-binding RTX toxin-like protein